MARPRGRQFASGARRLTQWIGPALQGYVNVADAGATLIASAPFDEAATIVRTRGMVSIRPQSAAASADFVGAIGIGTVSSEALGVGVTAIPEPFTDADWGGWYVWRSFGYRNDFDDATGVQLFDWGFEVDSKAMRKVGSNESLVMVAESFTGAYSVSMAVRTLVKLS